MQLLARPRARRFAKLICVGPPQGLRILPSSLRATFLTRRLVRQSESSGRTWANLTPRKRPCKKQTPVSKLARWGAISIHGASVYLCVYLSVYLSICPIRSPRVRAWDSAHTTDRSDDQICIYSCIHPCRRYCKHPCIHPCTRPGLHSCSHPVCTPLFKIIFQDFGKVILQNNLKKTTNIIFKILAKISGNNGPRLKKHLNIF